MKLFRRSRKSHRSMFPVVVSLLLVLGTAAAVFFTGCGAQFVNDQAAEREQSVGIYYRDADAPATVKVPFDKAFTGTDEDMAMLITALQTAPADKSVEALLPENVMIRSYTRSSSLLSLDFSPEYYQMEPVQEVLARSGYVKTLLQIEGINSILFTVDGDPLVLQNGREIGRMNANTFIENAGKSVNSILNRQITLFFTDETGAYLMPEGRAIYYNSNKPLEWAIVERLIAGPKSAGCYRTIAADTSILSVSIQDRICYVNLSESSQAALAVSDDVMIYSLVDSLVYNCDVDKVQISINGNADVSLGSVNLNQLFEKKSDIIAQVNN